MQEGRAQHLPLQARGGGVDVVWGDHARIVRHAIRHGATLIHLPVSSSARLSDNGICTIPDAPFA
jgi:nitrous oxidase accessory protein NosD